MAAACLVPVVFADVYTAVLCWPSQVSSMTWATWLASIACIKGGEIAVLKPQFARLNGYLYAGLALALPVWLILSQVTIGLWPSFPAGMLAVEFGALGLTDGSISATLLHAFLGVPAVLVTWIALGRAAYGITQWALWIVAACFISFAIGAYAPVDHYIHNPDWAAPYPITSAATYVRILMAEVTYALISGVGVSRLIPKPW